jgi:hypothetical protein
VGRVYVFAKTASGWKQTAVLSEPEDGYDSFDHFGASVAIAGNILAATGTTEKGDSGVALSETYVFARTAAGWKQTATLVNPAGGVAGPVAISGTTIVAGSIGAATGAGRAYVYDRTAAGAWKLAATLKGSDTTDNGSAAAGDHFGASVAISGTTIAVGAPQHAGGRVYVFARARSGWKQVAELKVSDLGYLGASLALSGGTILTSNAQVVGPVFVFADSRAGWKRIAELNPPSASGVGDSGAPVALSGSLALVGSPQAGGNYSGRAYLYQA